MMANHRVFSEGDKVTYKNSTYTIKSINSYAELELPGENRNPFFNPRINVNDPDLHFDIPADQEEENNDN